MSSICPHPWRRFFARVLDFSFYIVFSTLIFAVFLGRNQNYAHSWLSRYIFIASTYVIGAFIEGILLHLFATTPGKMLFGIKLSYSDGRNLSIMDGAKRALGVWLHVLGLSLPFVSIFTGIRSYRKCKSGKSLPYENYYVIYHTKFSNSVFVVLFFHIFFTFFANISSVLPDHLINLPNKGEMTQDEFMENYEYITGYFYNNNGWMERDTHGQFKTDRHNSRIEVYSEHDKVLRVTVTAKAWLEDLCMVALAFSGGTPPEIHDFMQSDTYTLLGKDFHNVLFHLEIDDNKSYFEEKFTFSGYEIAVKTTYSWDNQTYSIHLERILR